MKTNWRKIILLSALTLMITGFTACEDDDDGCNECNTKILYENQVWKRDLSGMYGSVHFYLAVIDGIYIIVAEPTAGINPIVDYYYICNPQKVKKLVSPNEWVQVNLRCNVRQKHDDLPDIDIPMEPMGVVIRGELEVLTIEKSE